MPQLPQCPLPVAEQGAQGETPGVPQEEPLPAPAPSWQPPEWQRHQVRRPPAHPVAVSGQRQDDPSSLPEGITPYEATIRKAQRPLVRQRRNTGSRQLTPPRRETQSVGGVDAGHQHPWPWTAAGSIRTLAHTISPTGPPAASGNIPIPRATGRLSKTLRRLQRAAGHCAIPEAGAGGRPSAALTGPTAGPKASGTTPNTTSSRALVQEVPHPGYRDPERRWHDPGRPTVQGPG